MQFMVTIKPSSTHVNKFWRHSFADWDLGVIPSFWSVGSRHATSSRAALRLCLRTPEPAISKSKVQAFNQTVSE